MRRNVSDDGDVFKETKLIMYSMRENHGYVAKTDMLYAKQLILGKFLLFTFVNISKPQKLSARPNCFWELSQKKISLRFCIISQRKHQILLLYPSGVFSVYMRDHFEC